MVALLRGDAVDLDFVALDMRNVPAFHQRVYEVARSIKPGSTLTYGEVAAQMGQPGAARSVGQALGRNPFPIVVPCHRVLAAGGKMGGFSAAGGITTKLQMLTIEGARANRQKALFDGDGKFPFDADAAVKHLREADPSFARTLDDVGTFAMELKSAPSIFSALALADVVTFAWGLIPAPSFSAALADAIVYQQLSGKAAATIFARVRAL